ncbi:MAG: hypothetical protein OXG08_14000 [Gammaproteobacteria bacterium]|nr:hypothetical protein [Gammaproteobacteria bacterium]
MKSTRSQGTFVALLTLAFVLGICTASAVYWLLVAPARSDDMAAATEPSSVEEETEPKPIEQIDHDVTSSSSQTAMKTVRNLDELQEIKSAFERSVALRNLLLESNEAQVVELLAQSEDRAQTNYRFGMQVVVVQRLAQLNPKRALSRVLRMDPQEYNVWQFITSVFEEWAHSDLDEAVLQARTIDENWKEVALQAIVQERMDLSEEILLAIARDLGYEQVAVGAITGRKIEDALEDDPERAWNELAIDLQNDRQHMRNIARVATAWVEQDGTGVLDQINQSLTNNDTKRYVLRNVLSNVARSDPAGAFRFAVTVDNDQYSHIASGVIDTWAQTDPQAALAAASEVERRTLRRQLEESVVRAWGYSKPREVLDNIDVLPAHLQPTAISTAMSHVARNSPEEAAALVVGMNSGNTRTAAAIAVVGAWVNGDHEAALEWILNEPTNKEIKTQLLQGILWQLVRIDPQLAMDTAVAQPIEQDDARRTGMALEVTVISSLAYSDLDKAIELLPQVRKGPYRLQAYQMVSGAMIRDGDVDEALNLAQQLAESDRESFYMSLATAWAGTDPEGLLNSMNRLPSKGVKSRAAMMLLSFNRHQENLTEEQVENAKKHLTDEDAKALEEGGENVYYGW